MFREIKLEDFPEEISDYSTEKNDDIPFYIKAIEGANFRWNDELDVRCKIKLQKVVNTLDM